MDKPFFPNQTRETLHLEMKARQLLADLPEQAGHQLYEVLAQAHPDLQEVVFELAEEFVKARQLGADIHFARPVPPVILSHIIFGYEAWLQHKYALPGFVEVAPGDVVVDCGAFVGGFSLSAARLAKEVHLFEPEARNHAACVRNMQRFENAVVNLQGLYKTSCEQVLNLSGSSVEHSLLQPDDGEVVAQRRIQLVSLRDYCAARRIEHLDFVKIEAEGVELEVFEGLQGLRPHKLAIDVSPERNGESPAAAFQALLEPLGYEVRRRGRVMFAKRDAGETLHG